MRISEYSLEKTHGYSFRNKDSVLKSKHCYCFHCISVCLPSEIIEWVDNNNTALCPVCGIDSIIGSKDKDRISLNYLLAMRKHWFNK